MPCFYTKRDDRDYYKSYVEHDAQDFIIRHITTSLSPIRVKEGSRLPLEVTPHKKHKYFAL